MNKFLVRYDDVMNFCADVAVNGEVYNVIKVSSNVVKFVKKRLGGLWDAVLVEFLENNNFTFKFQREENQKLTDSFLVRWKFEHPRDMTEHSVTEYSDDMVIQKFCEFSEEYSMALLLKSRTC